MKLKKHQRQRLASLLGVLTTLVTAVALVNFDTLVWTSVNTYVKLLILLLPAAGGIVSEVSESPQKSVE